MTAQARGRDYVIFIAIKIRQKCRRIWHRGNATTPLTSAT